MGKRKRPFIDRKNAVRFRLLHRSQKDPLIANEALGERVLHPISADAKEIEERHRFGIYYRDDYDYLQHLKEVGETVEIIGSEPMLEREVINAENPTNKFNSCIFETRGVELKVGMLSQGAPSNELLPDIDPDIVAALDGELDMLGADDQLEEDFVAKANATGGKDGGSMSDYRNESIGRAEILQRFGLRNERGRFSDESSADEDEEEEETDSSVPSDVEERKTTFTNYSMSSSVIKRPGGLRLIDDHFETLYEEQYAKDGEHSDDGMGKEGGAQTTQNSEQLLSLLDEKSNDRICARFQRKLPDSELKQAVLCYAKKMEDNGMEQTEDILVDSMKKGRWDCESILSTHSTLYNHPTAIKEMTKGIGKRKGKATDGKGLGRSEDMEVDGDDCGGLTTTPSVRTRTSTVSSIRPKGETAEERRTRKRAVREERRERRKEKKANTEAFRAEGLKMEAQRKANLPKIRPIH